MIRVLWSAVAVLALASGPAVSGEVKTGGIAVSGTPPLIMMMMQPGGHPLAAGQAWGQGPLAGPNGPAANNAAAGFGNLAPQHAGALANFAGQPGLPQPRR